MDAPAVAVSATADRLATAWMDMHRGADERDVVLWSSRDGTPSPHRILGTRTTGPQGHPALAFDGAESLHAVWESERRIVALNATRQRDEVLVSDAREEAAQPSIGAAGDLVIVAYEATRDGKPVAIVVRP